MPTTEESRVIIVIPIHGKTCSPSNAYTKSGMMESTVIKKWKRILSILSLL